MSSAPSSLKSPAATEWILSSADRRGTKMKRMAKEANRFLIGCLPPVVHIQSGCQFFRVPRDFEFRFSVAAEVHDVLACSIRVIQ
jgi:hypothetical protein